VCEYKVRTLSGEKCQDRREISCSPPDRTIEKVLEKEDRDKTQISLDSCHLSSLDFFLIFLLNWQM